jgi:hypothetical protein
MVFDDFRSIEIELMRQAGFRLPRRVAGRAMLLDLNRIRILSGRCRQVSGYEGSLWNVGIGLT